MSLLLVVVALSAAATTPASAATASTVELGQVGFGSIAVDDAGQRVFVSEPKANVIDEFDFHGNLVATVPDIYGAWGMTIAEKYLYVVESTTGDVVRLDLESNTLTPQTIATGLNRPEWLVMTGGQLWCAEEEGGQWGSVVSIDPITGLTTTLSGSYYEPDLAVSPGDPSTLFVAEDGVSPGSIYRFDVSTAAPTQTAYERTEQENIEDVVVSDDGTRVIPAAGWPYLFEELSASTLKSDGLRYPGDSYPSAVAVSESGLLATGISNGAEGVPDIAVYPLGAPAAIFTATAEEPGTGSVRPHGLALSANGETLFAVTESAGEDLAFTTFSLDASESMESPSPIEAPIPRTGSPSPQPQPGGSRAGSSGSSSAPSGAQPPQIQISPKNPHPGRPDVYVELGAARESLLARPRRTLLGYRYFFVARKIRCINGATDLVFAVGHEHHTVRCTPGPILISTPVAPLKTYNIRVLAVRMHRHRIVQRGASYSAQMYMPGNEASWYSIAQLPPTF